MRALPACLLAAIWVVSCGASETGEASSPSDPTTSASTAEVFYESGDGLRCPVDLFEDEIADYASDAPGFDSIEAAADDYWRVQPGQSREERSGMAEEIRSDASILYSDTDGNGKLILRFEQYPNGWIQTGKAQCATP